MDLLYLLWGVSAILLASICAGGTANTPVVPQRQSVVDDEDYDDMEGGNAPPINPRSDLDDGYEHLDPYAAFSELGEEDLDDLQDIQLMLSLNKERRSIKYKHERKMWSKHVEMLVATKEFDNRFRMNLDEFEYLLDEIEDAITVSYVKSRASTDGNDPIYPEIVMACGLRYLGLGDSPATLSDLYGMSVSSARRVINMFLDAIDFNNTFEPLQVTLPDPNDHEALHDLASRWQDVSTAFGLFNNHLGALDGWLPRTEMPWDISNQTDYFSGHYQCYGLNVQAMCDPDLLFLYIAVAAPGRTNDIRAYGWCNGLHAWLEALPEQYFISADNAYPLSKRILIPFCAGEAWIEHNRTYNFYLSQLRIRIEMTFGLLTTKWRRLRIPLNCSTSKNAKIIRVCTKLHNYCIRMKHLRGEGRVPRFEGNQPDPLSFGIAPMNDGGNRTGRYGHLSTIPEDEPFDYSTLAPDMSRRNAIVADVEGRSLRRPKPNVNRNG